MNHFLHDHDVIARLHDLDVVVVRAGQRRQRAGDAALPEAPILGIVGVGRDQPPRLRARGLAFLRLRRQRRDAAVGRIDDERGLRPEDLRAAVPPEIVVGARDVGVRAGAVTAVLVPALDGRALELGDFLGVGEGRLVAKRRGPLERRDGRVAPDALLIGPAVRVAGRCGFRLSGHGDPRDGDERNDCGENSRRIQPTDHRHLSD
jgi:hypothetical protein